MAFSTHKTLTSTGLFSLMLVISILFTPVGGTTTMPVQGLVVNIPYVFALAGLVLSLVFNNSREFNLFLLLAISYLALQNFVWHPHAAPVQSKLLLTAITILLPLNFALSDLLRERGIFSNHGIIRLLILGLQISLVVLFLQLRIEPVNDLLNTRFLGTAFPQQLNLPDLAALVIFITAIWFAIRCFTRTSCLQNSTLFGFIAIIIALHHIDNQSASTLWFIVAEGIILFGILLNTYNLAYVDELTGLHSRRVLKQHMNMLDKRYSIAMLDIDFFKRINDSLGHDIRDQVLRMIAGRIRQTPGARVYRYGGEEFALVFPGKDEDESMVLLESLRARIEEHPFQVRARLRPRRKPEFPRQRSRKKSLTLSVSIGLASKKPHFSDAYDVLKAADRALYRAKRAGRNRVLR